MKRIINYIVTRPIICLLIFIALVFVPPAIAEQPQSYKKLLVTEFSIDKVGDEYEVSVVAYIPKATSGYSENYKLITSKGDCFFKAINNISNLTGKEVALSQSHLILVNDELCKEGLIEAFDYLVREYSLGNNSIVLNTGDVPAKDVLKASNELFKSSGISLERITIYDEESLFANKINLEKIFSGAFAPSKCSILGVITLKDDNGIEVDGSTQESQPSSSSQGEEAPPPQSSEGQLSEKKLANEGNAIVLKSGKKVMDLTYKEIIAFNWLKGGGYNGPLTLEHFTDSYFTDAHIELSIYKNIVKTKTFFEDNRPVCDIYINPTLVFLEANQESQNIKIYENDLSPEFKDAIKNQIGSEASSIMRKLIDKNIDLLSIYENFYANNTQAFKKYLFNLSNPDYYIKEIEFRLNIDIKIK